MGTLLLAFAALLLLAVLLSSLAHRTILSTAALFLIAGFVLGDGALGVLSVAPDDEIVATLAELAQEVPAWHGVARRLRARVRKGCATS